MADSKRPNVQEIVHRWWQGLTSEQSGYACAALARIRRANTPLEVMQEPVALRLVSRLLTSANPDRVATLAGVLAHVKEDEQVPVARAVGRNSLDDDRATLSEGRFRRLLQTDGATLLDPMRRLVRMTNGHANVRDLASTILYWDWGDRVKKEWIFQYYGVAPVARSDGTETQEQPTTETDDG